MARTWASGDNIFVPIGGLVGVGSVANTLVVIAKRGSNGTWMTPTAIQPSAGNPTVALQISNTDKLSYTSGATDKDTGITWQAADGWSLLAVDKTGGTGAPNGHLYVYSTNTWTHSTAGSTVGGNSTDLTGGKVQHGRWATSDPYVGDVAVAGIWKRQLSQTEIEYLAISLQKWYDAAPDYMVLFDQASTATAVIDLITGNTQQSASGTSVSTSSVPVFSYGFDLAVPSFVSGGGSNAEVTPGTVAAVAAVPSPALATGSTVTPASVTAVASVPAATVSAGTTVTPGSVTATAAVPIPTVSTGSTVTPATVAGVAAVPDPTVSTSGNANVTPATVSAVAAVPSPTVATGSTVLPATVASVIAVPAPAVAVGSVVSATAVSATAGVPAASVSSGSTIAPGAVSGAAAVPAPSVDAGGNINVAPPAVAAVVTIQSVTVRVGSTLTPTTVAALATVPAPAVTTAAKMSNLPLVTTSGTRRIVTTSGRRFG